MKVLALLFFLASSVLGGLLYFFKQRFEKKTAELESQAGRETAQARAQVERDQEEANTDRAEIKRIKIIAQEEQERILEMAAHEAEGIVKDANLRAETIAGDAYEAMKNAKKYTASVKAMKNTIKGYGNEYLIPNQSVVDELAEEYSFDDSGTQLKLIREKTRQMIKGGQAALCDYVEDSRKTTAINFVVDAFNGKVDSVLSKAKHDNYGKLNQAIEDAFHLVNHNGTAFRNARIDPEYLEARRNELKWLVAVNEVRLKEKEEQKRIKQEMREEEKARREYEKAIKTAEKEEKLLQDAMKTARAEMAAATEDHKAEFEKKLAELEQKLTESEEKNRRALSMAQQTKRGHVYVISNVGSFGEKVVKVGLTRRLEPLDRVKELGDASVPFSFDVHAMIFSENAPGLENQLHKQFDHVQMNKMNLRKEFFRISIAEIKKAIEEIGIEAKWTIKAEAREYRETLAMENKSVHLEDDALHDEMVANKEAVEVGEALSTAPVIDIDPTEALEPSTTPNQQPQEVASAAPPKEPEADAQATDEIAPENVCPCPLCNASIDWATLVVGSNTCPHCSGVFEAA